MRTPITPRNMARAAVMSVVIVVCSWLTVPAAVPFTMQTFGVFCTLMLLGGRLGTYSVVIYVLLGAVGMPVFSGFTGGIGRLLGATGGYIFGFILAALVYRLVTYLLKDRQYSQILGCVLGLLVCYTAGSVWFVGVYSAGGKPVSTASVLSMCVLPFLVPDVIKLLLASALVRTLKKHGIMDPKK